MRVGIGSSWSPLTVATFTSTAPSAVADGTTATMSSVTVEPAGRLGAVQVTAPLWPTAGVAQERPALGAALWNATPGGNSSASTSPVDVPGPQLVATRCQVSAPPGAITSADTVLTTPRSTCGAGGTSTLASSQPEYSSSGWSSEFER